MRRTLILTAAVLVCALAMCALSLHMVNTAVDEALELHGRAMLAADAGQTDDARALVAELSDRWRSRGSLMELLASHDALHDVGGAIAEAAICLDCDDRDDFLCAMSRLAMGLEHLKDEEAVRWENVY